MIFLIIYTLGYIVSVIIMGRHIKDVWDNTFTIFWPLTVIVLLCGRIFEKKWLWWD